MLVLPICVLSMSLKIGYLRYLKQTKTPHQLLECSEAIVIKKKLPYYSQENVNFMRVSVSVISIFSLIMLSAVINCMFLPKYLVVGWFRKSLVQNFPEI